MAALVWGEVSNASSMSRSVQRESSDPNLDYPVVNACVGVAHEGMERVGWSSVQGNLPADNGRAQGRGDRPGVCRRHDAHLNRSRRECSTVATTARPKVVKVPLFLLRQVPVCLSCRWKEGVSVNR